MTSPTEHALQSKTCARSLAYPEPESSWLCSWASQTYQQCSHGQKSVTAWPPRTRIDVELGLRLQTSRKITTRKTVHFQTHQYRNQSLFIRHVFINGRSAESTRWTRFELLRHRFQIVFKFIRIRRPHGDAQPAFSNLSTLESVFKFIRFRCVKTPFTCGRNP